MSIESEMSRIEQNVYDALSAVAEYSVDVPSDANSDNLSELIHAIPKATIVQEIGDSTTNVMSQKAVTDAIKAVGGAGGKTALDTFLDNVDVDYAYDEATGAYYTIIRVYKTKIDGTKQFPFVYRPDASESGNKSSYDLAAEEGLLLVINGGIFNTASNKAEGVVIQNGKVVYNSPSASHSQCKPLTIDGEGNLSYAAYDASAYDLVNEGIVSTVCGFMPIIVDYESVPESDWNNVGHYTENAQRQIIGQWGNGDYAIITCEGRSFHNSDGWTIAEAQSICQKHGLKFAYNLDGGGSTETMLGLKPINTIYEGTTGRKVPTFIVFNGGTTFKDPVLYDEGTYTNKVPTSIDTDGSVFNETGYMDGYRLSSSGEAKAQDGSAVTGFIPINSDLSDIIRIAGVTWGSSTAAGTADGYLNVGLHCYIVVYDATFNKLLYVNYDAWKTADKSGSTTAWTYSYDADTGVAQIGLKNIGGYTGTPAYIRINAAGNGADMIVTLNEEISV